MNYRDLAVVLRRRAQLLLDAAAALESIETVEAPGRRGRRIHGARRARGSLEAHEALLGAEPEGGSMSQVEPHAYGCSCDGCQRMIKAINSEAFTDSELETLAIQTPRCECAMCCELRADMAGRGETV